MHHSPKNVLFRVRLNRHSSSEEVGNVKRLQTDGQTDSRRTKCDQKS